MLCFVEILIILAIALIAVTPILVIIYLLYRIAKGQEARSCEASMADQIEGLARLKDQGILSEEEFQEKKKELLARM